MDKRNRKKIPITAKISLAYMFCSILQNGLSFITLPLFTRLLTTEQYGQYSIYASWSGIFMIFITLNAQYGTFSKAMVKYEQDRSKYIAAVQGICFVLSMAFLACYLPFAFFWNRFLELPTWIICVMIAEIVANFSLACWYGKNRFEYKYKAVIVVTLLCSVMAPFAAYFFVTNTAEKGYARIAGYAMINILIGGFFFAYNLIKGKCFYNKEYWKYVFGFNGPLVIYYLSQVIFNQSDRIMISHFDGTAKAGIYGVAYSFAMLLTFVMNAINNAYVPWFYEKLKDYKEWENRKISCILACLMAVLLLGVIWLAPEIILIMAGKSYYEAIWIIPPIAMSVLLLLYSQFFLNVEFFYEEKKMMVYSSVGAALINLVLNYLLIPKIGYLVAGYTTLFSYLIFTFMNYLATHQLLKRNNRKNPYNMCVLLLIGVCFMGLSFLGMMLYNNVIVRYMIIIVGILVVSVISAWWFLTKGRMHNGLNKK